MFKTNFWLAAASHLHPVDLFKGEVIGSIRKLHFRPVWNCWQLQLALFSEMTMRTTQFLLKITHVTCTSSLLKTSPLWSFPLSLLNVKCLWTMKMNWIFCRKIEYENMLIFEGNIMGDLFLLLLYLCLNFSIAVTEVFIS